MRKLVLWGCFAYICFWFVWVYFTTKGLPISTSPDFWLRHFESMVNTYKYLFFTWQGWVTFLMMISPRHWVPYLKNKEVHFECPIKDCRTQIFVNEPWECRQCRDDKITTPYLFRTFFDKCKHGHKPESYECPTCEKVFELIPNGYKDLPAKKAVVPLPQPPPQVVQLPPPPPPPVQGEVMPRAHRDRNFFG
jgi:hypothetical protein